MSLFYVIIVILFLQQIIMIVIFNASDWMFYLFYEE